MYPLVPLTLETSHFTRRLLPPAAAPLSVSLDIPKSASLGLRFLPSAQNPHTLTRFMWLILPMTATSAQNSASPCVTPSSLFTATAVLPSSSTPL
ncbi:unnamed protein product [Spirodela intermedia]|uniref:Uncharacterized protein n=1 Tax=Spirodela intermedia TaxID=51605 RepID=A0A7I8J357_SPIIN|nr:unnamed protein product [Spirodela intermedia]CAA6664479.1 unnamed protein product [Spirodela intermedia]